MCNAGSPLGGNIPLAGYTYLLSKYSYKGLHFTNKENEDYIKLLSRRPKLAEHGLLTPYLGSSKHLFSIKTTKLCYKTQAKPNLTSKGILSVCPNPTNLTSINHQASFNHSCPHGFPLS